MRQVLLGTKRSCGMTLLELTIAVSLVGIVGLTFGILYTSSQRFLIQSINLTSSQGDASFAVEHIKRRLLQTTAITVPAVGGTVTALSASGTTTLLTFDWQPSTAGGTLNSTYRLNGAALTLEFQRASPNGTWEPISRGIQSVTFTRPGRNVVKVVVNSERKSVDGDTRNTELQTIVTPRGLL